MISHSLSLSLSFKETLTLLISDSLSSYPIAYLLNKDGLWVYNTYLLKMILSDIFPYEGLPFKVIEWF